MTRNKKIKWLAYSDLAWTESIIASPDDYAEDTERYIKLIKECSGIEIKSLLHLGCGAGGNDYIFKKHFNVTGVDISEGMLKIARNLNPEISYVFGDMREINLNKTFDAIAIPDSIDYLTTTKDLRSTILTAHRHLNPGGVLLIIANISEDFKENNFVYTGSREDIEITLFENNFILKSNPAIYEATLVYLIRRNDKLEVFSDRHVLGLFPLSTWVSLLTYAGFELKQDKMEHFYNHYILDDGEYRQRVFVGRK